MSEDGFRSEQRAIVTAAGRTFGRCAFPLPVELVQQLFQEVEDPFEILPRAGVFLAGRSGDVGPMTDALIDLWNYTARRELDGQTPVERYRREARAGLPFAEQTSKLALSPHNLHLVRGALAAGREGEGSGEAVA